MVRAALELDARNLNRGTSGNVGVRCGKRLLVTPSGVPARELTAQGMVLLAANGDVIGAGHPSSEWRFHRDILASRPDVHAVVHVHSAFATTLACLGIEVPPFHYMIAAAGGSTIRCAPYALFGTQELSDAVLELAPVKDSVEHSVIEQEFRRLHAFRGAASILRCTRRPWATAVRSFARTFASDLKARRIRVNAISPGITRTPVLDNAQARVTRVEFTAGAREPVHGGGRDDRRAIVTTPREECDGNPPTRWKG